MRVDEKIERGEKTKKSHEIISIVCKNRGEDQGRL